MKDKLKQIVQSPSFFLIVLYSLAVIIGVIRIIQTQRKEKTRMPLAIQFKPAPNAIAVVPVYGMISVADAGPVTHSASADRIVKRLKQLSEREDVKAVILRINSPGGSVGAVQEIYDQVLQLRSSGKKVVVSIGDVAASGGYYIASASDKIFADPGSITGSIGVIMQVGNVQELFKKIGVKIEAIKSAQHKDIGSPFREMTLKEKELIQAIITDTYNQFVDAIVKGRNMKRETVLELADGRIFSGAQAKQAGLVDVLGNMQSAIAEAAKMAGIEGKPRILYEEDPFQKLLSYFVQESKTKIWDMPASAYGMRFAYLWEYAL